MDDRMACWKGWVHAWMDGRMHKLSDGLWADGWMTGPMAEWTDSMDGGMHSWMDERTDHCMNGMIHDSHGWGIELTGGGMKG